MHRLFVAIRPPASIRTRLLDLMEGVNGARWQDEDQLHLTLRFIGEVGRHQAEDIAAALAAIHHPGFELALSGLGSFDRRGRPTSLWAGITPHAPLLSLHRKVDQAVKRAGLESEHRAYLPHITIARLASGGGGSIAAMIEREGGLSSPLFPVDSFVLYQSELTHSGAIYNMVERYRLDG